jgi:hypothetical protein
MVEDQERRHLTPQVFTGFGTMNGLPVQDSSAVNDYILRFKVQFDTCSIGVQAAN